MSCCFGIQYSVMGLLETRMIMEHLKQERTSNSFSDLLKIHTSSSQILSAGRASMGNSEWVQEEAVRCLMCQRLRGVNTGLSNL